MQVLNLGTSFPQKKYTRDGVLHAALFELQHADSQRKCGNGLSPFFFAEKRGKDTSTTAYFSVFLAINRGEPNPSPEVDIFSALGFGFATCTFSIFVFNAELVLDCTIPRFGLLNV